MDCKINAGFKGRVSVAGFLIPIFLSIFLFQACSNKPTPREFKHAIYKAYTKQLKKYGIKIEALLFVLRYDKNPSANAVSLFYREEDAESFEFLISHFKNPEELQNWLEIYIKENIEVLYE
ncbi:MAG: hypothetical protein J7L62_02945 [Candidatus Aminicenantes bacterium]|nr:hypothetical protein [Candidatus Aminicenantes bacterium]